jgi:hypothetical protein
MKNYRLYSFVGKRHFSCVSGEEKRAKYGGGEISLIKGKKWS